MMMPIRRLFLLALCGLLCACAATPRISNSWRATDYAGPTLRKLMVVGVGVDGASRRSFEDAVVLALQANGVEAVASYSRNVDPAGGREVIEKAALAAGMQGFVETRVLRAGSGSSYYGGGPVIMPSVGFGSYGSYAGASVVFGSSGSYEVGATVESNLLAVPGARMLWSLTADQYYESDPQAANAGLAKLLVEQMRKQGLI